MLLRLIKFVVLTLLLMVVGFFSLFALYGWQAGHDVGSGLVHLFESELAPVTENPALDNVPWQRVSWLGDIKNRELSESSGLAASTLHPNVLWSLNDSGNEPKLYAIALDGADLGAWSVDVDQAVDWESMDAFVYEGVSYLVIGDTGDNFRWRGSVSLVVVPEPTELVVGDPIRVAWQVTYHYPNGYRDSEAMAVDAQAGFAYVLSKRHNPAELYRVPLFADREVAAEQLAELIHLPKPTAEEFEEDPNANYRHTPTGMDLAGHRLLVTTYKDAFLYDLRDMRLPPLKLGLPTLGQREALTFAHNKDDVAYISRERAEGKGVADLFQIKFRLPPVLSSSQTPPAAAAGDQ